MLTRRDWLAWFGAAVPTTALVACKHDASSNQIDAARPDAPAGFFPAVIGSNHPHAPHSLMVPIQDAVDSIRDGQPRTYSIQGMANHDHMVTFTTADFQMLLQQATAVAETSTMAGCPLHDHVCTLSP
jgi:hypothetical protein